MKLISSDGTAKEVVVITQEHLHALTLIATAALALNQKIDEQVSNGFRVSDVITRYNGLLWHKLINHREL